MKQMLYVRDMSPSQLAFGLAYHDIYCDEEPKGHPLSDHEPWSGDEIAEPWEPLERSLNAHGWAFGHGAEQLGQMMAGVQRAAYERGYAEASAEAQAAIDARRAAK